MARVNLPSLGLSGPVPTGATLHEGVRGLGHIVDNACGGNSLCGTCCVLVVEGEDLLTPVEQDEARRLAEMTLGPPYRLSCQARVSRREGEITIVVC